MPFTAEPFMKLMNGLPERVMIKDWIGQKAWIVPLPFRAIQLFKDAIYLPGDTTLGTARLHKPREKNVHTFSG